MNKLNDDCLIYIFYNLNFFERVRIQLVCKNWYQLLQVKLILKFNTNLLFFKLKNLEKVCLFKYYKVGIIKI